MKVLWRRGLIVAIAVATAAIISPMVSLRATLVAAVLFVTFVISFSLSLAWLARRNTVDPLPSFISNRSFIMHTHLLNALRRSGSFALPATTPQPHSATIPASISSLPPSTITVGSSTSSSNSLSNAPAAAASMASTSPVASSSFSILNCTSAVQGAIVEVVRLLVRDYVEYWYNELSSNDPIFPETVQQALMAMLANLISLLRNVDVMNLLIKDAVGVLREHFRSIRVNPRHFPSHPCLASPEAELLYLRQVADVLLHHLLPERDKGSAFLHTLLRELLACQVMRYCADRFCDPDYINQYVIYRCDQEALRAASARARPSAPRPDAYAYARDYDGFLRMIDTCEDPDVLKDVRYTIITEIMQAEHVDHIKNEARSGQGARSALAMLADTEKGAHLRRRNLQRYTNQLRQAKGRCEMRLLQLGGPDLRGVAHVADTREQVEREEGGIELIIICPNASHFDSVLIYI